jgi:hypothetical protein
MVREALDMPDDARLHAIEGTFSDAFIGRVCYLVVESPELPPVPEDECVPDIDAVIYREDGGRHTWRFAQ